METNDQVNENITEKTDDNFDVNSIKMEINDGENSTDPVTFSDANESISDIEESICETIIVTDNTENIDSISKNIIDIPKLIESITDESNTEEIKEDYNTNNTYTSNIIIETKDTIINTLDNILTETDIKIPNNNDFINTNDTIKNLSNTDNQEKIIPIADLVASDISNINKKHVTISDILIEPIITNRNTIINDTQSKINIDDSIILNNVDIDHLSNTNTLSEISYINKIKKSNFMTNKTFKHIQQIKPNKKNKNFELDQIDTVYNKLQDYIRNMNIDRTNYILLITKCVEIIDNLNNVTDNDRKQLAIKSINRIITVDLNLSAFDNNYIIENIDNSIELIITASKYKIKNSQSQKTIEDNDTIVYANAGQIIPSILDKIITIILKRRYTVEKIYTNLGTIVYILILFCEQYPYLNGVEKKNIVIQTMEQLIHIRIEYILKLTPEQKQELIQGLDSISYITDTLIALQKGKYKINRKNIIPNKKSFINFLCCKS